MNMKLDAKTFETRVDSAYKEIITENKTGKLLSTKVELKDSKTVGDRFKFIEKLLTKLGITVMSRTNEKDAAKALKQYAIDNKEAMNDILKDKLEKLVDFLRVKAEDEKGVDKAKVKAEFEAIKKGITDIPAAKKWEEVPPDTFDLPPATGMGAPPPPPGENL